MAKAGTTRFGQIRLGLTRFRDNVYASLCRGKRGLIMRIITTAALLTAIFPAAALAQDNCAQLKIVNTVQMTRGPGGRDLIPVRINGTTKNFLFDTGASLTIVGQSTVADLKLPIRQGRVSMVDLTGKVTNAQTLIDEYIVGHMRGTSVQMQVTPTQLDGIFGLDGWSAVDLDVDFGTDKLNMFSADHCPGKIQYWSASVLAAVPMKYVDRRLMIHVMLDGHEETAQIDTGSSGTTLTIDEAKRAFGLDLGSDDAPADGVLNGDDSLKAYKHQFKTLSFGDGAAVTVNNADVRIIPNAVGRNLDKTPLQGSRVVTEKDLMVIPDMLIGMNVLRKLHVYVAFGEAKLYVTDASFSAQPSAPTPQ
jgi:predicted aspartyl protease